jgi:hypothetical protein
MACKSDWCAATHGKATAPFFFAEDTITSTCSLDKRYRLGELSPGIAFHEEGAGPRESCHLSQSIG